MCMCSFSLNFSNEYANMLAYKLEVRRYDHVDFILQVC